MQEIRKCILFKFTVNIIRILFIETLANLYFSQSQCSASYLKYYIRWYHMTFLSCRMSVCVLHMEKYNLKIMMINMYHLCFPTGRNGINFESKRWVQDKNLYSKLKLKLQVHNTENYYEDTAIINSINETAKSIDQFSWLKLFNVN